MVLVWLLHSVKTSLSCFKAMHWLSHFEPGFLPDEPVCGHVWIIFVSMATLKTFEPENSVEGLSSKILVSYGFYGNSYWVVGLYLVHVSLGVEAETQPVLDVREPPMYSQAHSQERYIELLKNECLLVISLECININ